MFYLIVQMFYHMNKFEKKKNKKKNCDLPFLGISTLYNYLLRNSTQKMIFESSTIKPLVLVIIKYHKQH